MSHTCGECTMCCKLVGVVEFAKPPGEWCAHCDIGHGCMIYQTRPDGCRAFECLWLQEPEMSDDLRPDRCKAVLAVTKNGENIVVYIDQRNMNALESGPIGRFLARARAQDIGLVAVVGPDQRTILHLTRKMADTLTKIKEARA